MDIKSITEKFGLAGASVVSELQTGHTNRTYLIECNSGRYILQSLNRDIFKNPEIVMRNIAVIEKAFESETSILIPHYLKCDGKIFTEQDGNIWRICGYIESCPDSGNKYYSYGYAVGTFLRVVNSDGYVFETPMNLHNFRIPLIPVRNIHGDTKTDNIIIGEKPAIIDFDTAMRGYICADYGDMIRSVTTKSVDLSEVRESTQGFADGIGGILSDNEIQSLFYGIVCIIHELTSRYGEGVKNFPNKTPEQCRDRFFQLSEQYKKICDCKNEIENIINECFSYCLD